jgi:hypothetical protein
MRDVISITPRLNSLSQYDWTIELSEGSCCALVIRSNRKNKHGYTAHNGRVGFMVKRVSALLCLYATTRAGGAVSASGSTGAAASCFTAAASFFSSLVKTRLVCDLGPFAAGSIVVIFSPHLFKSK